MKEESQRRKDLGDSGEGFAMSLLAKHGFDNIQDLNSVKRNYPFADLYAEKGGKRYVISVKTRQKIGADGKENARHHLLYNGGDEKVRKAEEDRNAEAHWLVIQVDKRGNPCAAYFGSVRELKNPDYLKPGGNKNLILIPKCRSGEIGSVFLKDAE